MRRLASFAVVLITLSLLTGCASSSPENVDSAARSPAADDVTHGPSGMVFPKKVGGFVRSGVSAEAVSKTALSVDYRAKNVLSNHMELYLNVTVRVAPSGGASPEAVLRMVHEAFLRTHPKATIETTASGPGDFNYVTYVRPGWNDLGGVETHAVRRGNHILLFTFSFLAVRHEDWRGAIDQFLRSMTAN